MNWASLANVQEAGKIWKWLLPKAKIEKHVVTVFTEYLGTCP